MTTVAALGLGLVYGLAAGFAPGPLLTLVMTETLRHGARAGIKVAVAPLVTDTPIIALSVVVLTRVSAAQGLLGIVSLAGGVFLGYSASETWRVDPRPPTEGLVAASSLRKGILANLLNPHPYVFWATVGGPTLIRAYEAAPVAAGAFLATMYGCLIGSKILTAGVMGKGRSLMSRGVLLVTTRALAVALAALAVVFVRDGLRYLDLLGR